MQAHHIPIFEQWVPEWLARTVIFSILLSSLFSFALYSRPLSMAGYYGVEPTDVQYAMVLTYASAVAFLALDFRMIKYFTSRRYLLTGLALNIVSSLICFYTKDWALFLTCGFVQGIVCALICSIVLNLVFPRLQTSRARVIGYTVFYGGLQISIPFYAIYCSTILHFFDFNWLFYGVIIMILLVVFAVLMTMNSKSRFYKKIPLYQVDWVGYLFYILICLITGYILVYGQQLNWLDSPVVVLLTGSDILLLFLFVGREIKFKRPLINLQVFKSGNFVVGLLLLLAFYIFKGATGLTYSHLEVTLGTDPLHVIPIWGVVILGTTLSMYVTARLILTGTPLMRMITAGFVVMALYYVYMLIFVSTTGETGDFIFPMFLYGVATGMLFVPIVSFAASSVPAKIAVNASLIGIFARFLGFCISSAINNQVQLYTRAAVRDKLRESVSETNPQLSRTLQNIQNAYLNTGNDVSIVKGASNAYFNNLIKEQILARSTRDYYDIMLIGLVCLIVTLIFASPVQNVLLKLRKGNVPY
ncbi:MFS transporter [Pedobacter sp. FW305-3-2-15-E-R2A2]|uniref:MFS transporter n=1 Tax=Pedobacter sp. FW305-3-2-15-E-R2A2 TaxID=3140251 RepID=UPI00314087DD